MTDSAFEIFPWNDNFETGILAIDQQHRKLVDIINLLANHLANRSRVSVLEKVFSELADYAVYHFETEESIWRQHLLGDDWLIDHEKTHAGFFDQIVALKTNELELPFDEVIQQLLSFLTQWLAAHILDSDKRFAKVILFMEKGDSLVMAKKRANKEMSGATKLLIDTVLTMYESLSTVSIQLMREKALRKQAEQKLLESEERWKFLLENNEDYVWDWNIELNTLNHSISDPPLFDKFSTSIFNEIHENNIHPADQEQVKKDLQAHLDGKTDFYINKHRVLVNNACWKWVLSKGKVVSRDEDGNALRMIGVHIDISEKELATKIYQCGTQAIFVADKFNQMIAINPAFKEITGLSEADVIGKNPNILSSMIGTVLNSIQQTGSWSGEVWCKQKNGQEYCIAISINIVVDSKGMIEEYIGFFSDITEEKRQEIVLLQKEQEKRAIFNATISSTQHILNNLLNQMYFFRLKAEESNAFDAYTLKLFNKTMREGEKLIKKLSEVDELTEDSIKASVYPKN